MFQIDPSWFQVDLWLVILVIICVVVFFALIVYWGIRAHRHQIAAGKEDLVGKIAEVKIALAPKGVVFIQGERWAAVSEKDHIELGEEVIITKVDGLKLLVTKKE